MHDKKVSKKTKYLKYGKELLRGNENIFFGRWSQNLSKTIMDISEHYYAFFEALVEYLALVT